MNVSGRFETTPDRSEMLVCKTFRVRRDDHQMATCSKDALAFPKQLDWIVCVLYDMIQSNGVKRHSREPDIFQSAQMNFQSKSLARIIHRLRIDVLTDNIPSERPQPR